MASPSASIPTDTAPAPLAQAVRRTEESHERIILTRGGEPVAAMVPLADLEALEAIEDVQDAAAAAAALAEWELAGRPAGTSLAELAARHGIDPSAPEA
jgi:prevent-host-death family protein